MSHYHEVEVKLNVHMKTNFSIQRTILPFFEDLTMNLFYLQYFQIITHNEPPLELLNDITTIEDSG